MKSNHPFDLLPCEGSGITADRIVLESIKAPMSRETAKQIIEAVERYGKDVMRKDLLEEAMSVYSTPTKADGVPRVEEKA